MQRLSQAVASLCRPALARPASLACQSCLPELASAQQLPWQPYCWALPEGSASCSLRGFSSQGEAASPPSEVQEEQSARQPLARVQPKDMMAMYTCNVCKTRSAKIFSKKTYENGVVIVTCPGCQGRHLIADRLGWFGDPGSIEDYLQAQGQEVVKRTADGTTQLSAEDLMGWSKARELSRQQGQ